MIRVPRAPRALALVAVVLAAATSRQEPLATRDRSAGLGAPPQEVCFTRSLPQQTTSWADALTFPRFDACAYRGVLVGLSITLDAHLEGAAAAENLDAAPSTVTLRWSGRLQVLRPDRTELALAEPSLTFVVNLAAYDGTIDFDGPSGQSFPDLVADAQFTYSAPPPASDLALFAGAGEIVLPVSAQGTSLVTGSSNLAAQFSQSASASVTVCYQYVADCDCDGVPDAVEVARGARDCDGNGVPDECQADCDGDGLPDACEADSDGDGVPDDCAPGGGGEGCTPGYWKQPHHFDSWPAGLAPDMLFADVFEDAFPGLTLVEVLGQGGGGLKALGRHAVAALLNASSSGVDYDVDPSDVVFLFNDLVPAPTGQLEVLKDWLEGLNERDCPLN